MAERLKESNTSGASSTAPPDGSWGFLWLAKPWYKVSLSAGGLRACPDQRGDRYGLEGRQFACRSSLTWQAIGLTGPGCAFERDRGRPPSTLERECLAMTTRSVAKQRRKTRKEW